MEKLSRQNFCYICLNDDLLCSSKKVELDLETLELLKFLIVNVDVKPLENVMVGKGCLKKIAEASEYKYKNLTISLDILKDKILKLDCKYTICQKCETVLQRNDAFRLVDCVTKIDWLDFVNYLFKNPISHMYLASKSIQSDLEYLENSHICHSCQISLMNIQDILKLLYVYDQSKMQFNDNCNDTKASDDISSTEIKRELDSNDLNLLDNLVKNDHIEKKWINDCDENNDFRSYEDFKLKNEKIDLKFETDDDDNTNTEESTHECKKVDADKEISNDDCYINSADQEKEQEAIYPEVNNLETVIKSNYCEFEVDRMTNQMKRYEICHFRSNVGQNKYTENGSEFRHIFGAKKLVIKLSLDDRITKKMFSMQPRLKHNEKNDSEICKCQYCTYETRRKINLNKHIKDHENIDDFKCTLCSKTFTGKFDLDDHLLRIHKLYNCKNIRKRRKLYNCDQCSYECLRKGELLRHKRKHGITDDILILKCYQCTYQTYHKKHLVEHVKIHQNNKDFKCSLCSKAFARKYALDRHLLKIHKCRNVRKLYNCDQCSYGYLARCDLLKHKIKHSIIDDIPILKCSLCTFETYHKRYLSRHVKIHQNIKNFKCTLCSKAFTKKLHLDDHLLKIHNCENVKKRRRLYNCDQCSYECLNKSGLLKHKKKHGMDGIPILKCNQCTYQTYQKHHLIEHIKMHQNIKDFKCTLCSKAFSRKLALDDHLLKIHKCRNVSRKLYNCDQCSYACLKKSDLLRHKIKHGITDGIPTLKCLQCTFQTYRKDVLVDHVRLHRDIKEFKCSYCSKEFAQKRCLLEHVRNHKYRGATKKLHKVVRRL